MASESRIFRLLHGAPMFGGAPVHYTLALVALGMLGFFGGVLVSQTLGVGIALGVVVLWFLLVCLHRQDQTAVPLYLLRLRYRFPKVVSSYRPSRRRVVVDSNGSKKEGP